MGDIDWVKIRTEYVTTGISQRELANKYNLSLSGISKRAKAEDWVKKRESYQNRRATKVERKVIERDVEKTWTQMERLSKATDMLLEKVEIAIEQLDRYVLIQTTSSVKNENLKKGGKKRTTTKKEKISEGKSRIIDRKGLQEISTTLKNIKDIITVTGDGDEDEGGGVIEIAAVLEPPVENEAPVESETPMGDSGVIVYE